MELDTTPDEFLVGTSRHTSEEWKILRSFCVRWTKRNWLLRKIS